MTNRPHPHCPLVKKILALLVPSDDAQMYERAVGALEEMWGKPERISGRTPFTWTKYYDDISPKLDRIFFSWPGLFPVSELPDWKIATCRIEVSTGDAEARRRINLDPGSIDGARLLLASTKDNAQRIYLRDGIFCEITLCRRKGHWEKFFYTFPDFASGIYDKWLETVREDWKRDTRRAAAVARGAKNA